MEALEVKLAMLRELYEDTEHKDVDRWSCGQSGSPEVVVGDGGVR